MRGTQECFMYVHTYVRLSVLEWRRYSSTTSLLVPLEWRTEARWIEARGTEARGTEAMGD